ncbi:peptidylprolyl isomerase [Aquimarina sp. MMG016]|uniref:peptidylprolyl isomerase n=1 Tax=Aquimarina sp. MMG016 TaxID=2822690 RepID=UPI001B3A39E9|nr:peptidylprolyl isomerase [Aquimarina sp. MMG016]MBQ4820806.1 peptidylprolyl isomerase [Aquimarina sp. MMG016]
MAVLNKIRQRSVFLIVIIALALFSFVLADVIRNGGFISQKAQNTIATINGDDIDRTEFAKEVEAASANYRGGSTIQVVNSVWNQFVKKAVYAEQFEELGITVGKDQLNEALEEALANNPTFQNDAGVFDKGKMSEYVASVKGTAGYQQWLNYENTLGESAKEQTYLTMIKAGVGATLKEGEIAYKMENDNVDIKYVQLPFSSIPDADVKVSDAEIEAYIAKNPDSYEAEATRSIRYVFFKEEASKEDEDAIMTEVTKLLDDRIDFNSATNSNDSILGFKNTKDVEGYVSQNSALQYDDRFVFKKDLPATVADTLYNIPVGEVFGPYKDGEFIKVSRIVAHKQMPDSVKASHVLVSWEGLSTAGETKRTKEEAKTLADSIASVIKLDGSKFEALASQFSADNSNKDKGGDLGYFTPGRMVPAFNDFCFDNKTGDQGVVETAFGFHVIKINDQKNEQKAVKVATIARKIEPSEKTINDIFVKTTKFQMATKEGDYAEVAKTEERDVRPVNKIKELDENIPGLGAQRSIVQWAFNEESKIGEVKRFDVTDGYAVVQLTAKAAKGLMKAEDASPTVKPILIKEKKAEILKNKVSGTSLDAIASANSQTVKTASALNMKTPTISGAGTEPKVVGAAFALEEGKVSEPIIGNNGVYVVEVTKKTPAAGLDTYLSYASQTTTTQVGAVSYRVFNALKEAAEIEDKRAKFY